MACAGSYDGASVPVFGQLAGLDGSGLDDQSAPARPRRPLAPAQTLPAAALAAVVALAAVTAALVRTHQASRASLSLSRDRPAAVVPLGTAAACAFRRPAVDSAGGPPTPHAGSLVLRVPASVGARNACTTLLLQTFCSRQDQRRWGSPCVITN